MVKQQDEFLKSLSDNFLFLGPLKELGRFSDACLVTERGYDDFLSECGVGFKADSVIYMDQVDDNIESLGDRPVLIFTPNESDLWGRYGCRLNWFFFVRDIVFCRKVFPREFDLRSKIVETKKNRFEKKAEAIRKFLVFSLPRGGSTYFTDTFGQSGKFGQPIEHIQHDIMGLVNQKIFTIKEYFDFVFCHTATSNNVAMTKVIDGWFLNIYKNSSAGQRLYLKKLLANSSVIYLRRKNKISQAISAYKSRQTGSFHSKNVAQVELEDDVKYEFDEMYALLNRYSQKEDVIYSFLNDMDIKKLYSTTYEDFCKAPQEIVSDICSVFDVDFDVQTDFSDSKFVKISNKKSADIKERFTRDIKQKKGKVVSDFTDYSPRLLDLPR